MSHNARAFYADYQSHGPIIISMVPYNFSVFWFYSLQAHDLLLKGKYENCPILYFAAVGWIA
jgi:hypothetical protein